MIFLNASGGGVPRSEKWLCEQPSNHNYTQIRLRIRKCRNFPCRSTLFIFLWVYFQGPSNNSPLLIASSKGVCRRYTYFGFNIQRNLVVAIGWPSHQCIILSFSLAPSCWSRFFQQSALSIFYLPPSQRRPVGSSEIWMEFPTSQRLYKCDFINSRCSF